MVKECDFLNFLVVGFTNVEIEYAENTSFYKAYWKLISVLVKPIMG